MKTDVEALRKKYMDNPPEGLTSTDIRHMSEEDLLDMDYFLNDDDLDEKFVAEQGYSMDELEEMAESVEIE